MIGVAYTKDTFAANAASDAFFEGAKRHGEKAVKIRSPKDLEDFHSISKYSSVTNYITQYGAWNGGTNKLRGAVHDYITSSDTRRIQLDIGFIKNQRWTPNNLDAYVAVGFDSYKMDGTYHNGNCPPDRWNKLNITVKPWRETGNHILIIGQTRFGVSTRGLDYNEWLIDTIKQIRSITNRPIVYRQHPNQKPLPELDIEVRKTNPNIEDDLRNAWCSLTLNSNAAVDSIINGIPVVAIDKLCMTYEISSNHLLDIENPKTPNRQQFLNNLAYCQWSIDEIKQGLAWKHLRNI